MNDRPNDNKIRGIVHLIEPPRPLAKRAFANVWSFWNKTMVASSTTSRWSLLGMRAIAAITSMWVMKLKHPIALAAANGNAIPRAK